jgi:hypothetical protein
VLYNGIKELSLMKKKVSKNGAVKAITWAPSKSV